MPTYDYQCAEGHAFEVFQKMSDDPVAECPDCGADARRIISGGAGFLFKGEGFYITDYRSDDYKKKASAESGSAKAESGSKASAESGAAKPSDGSSSSGGTAGGEGSKGGGSSSSGSRDSSSSAGSSGSGSGSSSSDS
ncbi:MAG: FmdB family transcriptional regulator [Gemmatimonadota bacterium]|nr:FmdB family transcriptional regulator [Gemmatimonadota bacterium]